MVRGWLGMGRNGARQWADSRRDGVPRCRMELPWGEENWDQPVHASEVPLNGSAYVGDVLH